MPDELLTIFKLCFLALLYLFFFRVLRAVWTEVTTPVRPATPAGGLDASAGLAGPLPLEPRAKERRAERRARARAAKANPDPTHLAVLEPPALAGIIYDLKDGLTVGRAPDTDVTIDDSFLSGHHATVTWSGHAWILTDLGSTNGSSVNGLRVEEPVVLTLGDRVQFGGLVAEVR